MENLSSNELEILKNLFSDQMWRISNLYYIKDKKGKRVKFRPNEDQLRYLKIRHNRNAILKARQKGFTTLACILSLDFVLFTPFVKAGIIADDMDNAKSIFSEKVKFAYDNLPELIRKVRPANTDREGELKFNNNSSIAVDTSFRGGTIQKLHISEFGKIARMTPQKAIEIITGAFEAVPLGGEIDVESTAEGVGGEFYDMCMEALRKRDNGQALTPLDFKFLFFPWYESREYRLDAQGVLVSPRLEKYFETLKEKFGIELDQEQKAWYSKKEEVLKDKMKQEYPSYPEEAFLNSGRPVFDLEQISADIARVEKLDYKRGYFDSSKALREDPLGPLKLFSKPKSGHKYAIGADVAEGLEDGDFSTMTVIDKSWYQVASYHNHIHPDLFGDELINVGEHFKEALIAPEVNNHGLTTLTKLMNKTYKFLYKRRVLDERSNEYTEKEGWQTNVKTKVLMLDEFVAAYRDKLMTINDIETLREMMTVVYGADGKVNLNGKDRVVSAAIAIQAVKQLPANDLGVYESKEGKAVFANLSEYLENSEDAEESYFD